MQMSTRTEIVIRTDAKGVMTTEIGRTKTTVSLDPEERFASREWYGSSRQFQVVAFTLQHGGTASGTASGRVIRKDGTLGTARVASTAFSLADVPVDILTAVQAANQRVANEAVRIIENGA